LAPADEYFGPLKQSILGIRNSVRDMGLRYDVNHDIAPQTLASAALTEASIRDWSHKYPRDHEVPQAIFNLQRLYAKIVSEPARVKAKATADWLFASYGKSRQAKSLREILANPQPPTLATQAPPAPATAEPAPTPPYNSMFGPSYPSIFAPSAAPIVPGGSPTPH
jgi:hypothetical protein